MVESLAEPDMGAAQLAHLGPQPVLHLGPLQRHGEAGHGVALDLGEVGEPLEGLELEVADVAELVPSQLEEAGQRNLAAEEKEIHEVAAAGAADDGAELHQPEIGGGDYGKAGEVRERLNEWIRVIEEADAYSAAPDEEITVAGGLDLGLGRGGQQRGEQIAPVRAGEPVGVGHEVQIRHRAMAGVEGQ